MTTSVNSYGSRQLADLGASFAGRAAHYDHSNRFVAENYAALREAKLFSALVPEELGGGALSYGEMCSLIQGFGSSCPSTALAFSMHQHLVAAAVWNYRHGKPGEKLLRAVVEGERILVSTGAADWLRSSGSFVACDGGYRLTARKHFASGCAAGDLLLTSGRYEDPVAGLEVLHCSIPMRAEGVRIEEDWETMGMRGTGSHTVVLENVFVPEAAISLRRACGEYHPVWNVILTVALPLICAAYVGAAEDAAARAVSSAREKREDAVTSILLGEMVNELTTAQMAWEGMVEPVGNLDGTIGIEDANRALVRKTILSGAVLRVAEKALEVTGGKGYFVASGVERILRDLQAVQFHPLQAKKQHRFTGRLALGLDPAGE